MADTIFKKREGTLTLSSDSRILSWAPRSPPSAPPELTVLVANITGLQQTPPDKPKVMMKVFATSDKSVDPLIHVFTFSPPSQARAQAERLRDSLSIAIQACKNASNSMITAADGGQPGALAIANAISRPDTQHGSLYSDDRLWNNFDLHQDLLSENATLKRTYTEASRTKPGTISNTQFNKQFWSSRLGLLRAHAIERSQEQGEYNVLSVVKPRMEDEKLKLNVTKEQVALLLRQYPTLRRAYDENSPPLDAGAFWSRFFQSRLLKKLKGERITDQDPKDNLLDKYLSYDDEARLQKRLEEAHIPHTVDLEGNEQNHSQRKGNAPDLLMRPTAVDKVPIIRTLNSMSERLMSQVAPNHVDPSEPIGIDEETYNQLALRDLQGDVAENRLILNVKDQGRFFTSGKDSQDNLNLLTSAKTTPAQLLQRLQKSLASGQQGVSTHDLTPSLGLDVDSDSDSDDEDESGGPSTHFSSHRALKQASQQIFDLVAEQRTQNEDTTTTSVTTGAASLALVVPKSGLSAPSLDSLSLTFATTIEFLHYFWSTFLSGDPARAEEIASLATTLDRAKKRINAVAIDAESERAVEITKLKTAAVERGRRMGRPPVTIDEDTVKGGQKAVNRLMEPTIRAINTALQKYEEAMILSRLDNEVQS